MSNHIYYSPELLQPVSVEAPCGQDLRWEAVFREILDARRSDEALNSGDWEKAEGRKAADWNKVAELCLEALSTKSKDLRLVSFLAEASVHLDGFTGLRDSLRLCREMLEQYWDRGLYPLIEDGDAEMRASPLSWINEPMPDVIRQSVNITGRPGGADQNYSFTRYQQAQRMGTEAGMASATSERRETLNGLRKQGWINMDEFEAAVRATRRAAFEDIYAPFEEAEKELVLLGKIVDEKFGEVAPAFTNAREAFVQIRGVLQPILKKKRDEEPDKAASNESDPAAENEQAAPAANGAMSFTAGLPSDNTHSWTEAEKLVRSGKVDQGLAQMAALAAQETSGRARFLRKLMLADVCLGVQRDRLAKTILQELRTQINDYRLEQWENSAVVGAVWSRLYKIYKRSDSSSEQDQAIDLYIKLCQLDPWQAYLHTED